MNQNEIEAAALYSPAMPPHLAQDNYGQLVAPIPGMTKLEYAALQLLPAYINKFVYIDSAVAESIEAAKKLLIECTRERMQSMEQLNKPNLVIT